MHFRGYLAHPDRIEIVAAVDPSPERREWVTETFGITATFGSISEALEGADFEVAVVSTPSHVRLVAVEELAAAGIHLFVEKPLADGVAQAIEIVDVASAAGVLLAVDQNFRYHYAFGHARDAIREGRIGRVIAIDHRELMWREVTGWRAEQRHHSLSVMGVHWFDGFRFILGQEADWLVATTHRSPALEAAGETDASIHVRFADIGVNYTQSFSSRVERIETIVIGEAGTLLLDYDHLEIHTADGVETVSNPWAGPGKPESAFLGLDDLLTAIDAGGEPSNSGRDNLRTLSLLEAAYLSAETGEPVRFQDGVL
ncbi:Gfo/Idh/MocA family oxidoreductase [Microbacterium rhizomatis]|uniref:Gfo/Idh/MocA family oxidoreductase n=2 Tax=Microbacterium rhizomatis TaxID=1631477 RepID=A0A5J5J1A8_9MICO|nr:Gfo/Idh/MocA family oxidoreductase [Microbacterium rhizomatis]